MSTTDVAQLAINTIRTLSIDAVQKANSGHPGLPLGCAPMAYVLWQRHLKHDPSTPRWFDRDRFVLSAGHGSMLIYSLLHLYGYDLSLDELKNFRQWDSKTPGHPESFMTEGVEATTGPLGQGSANAVGMAMAERHLASVFNRPGHEIIDHFTFALVSDGDLMEGVSAEAGSLAGHLKLGKLIYLYDANEVTLDGPASMHFSEDVAARYESYGWQVLKVENGDTDLDALDKAIAEAKADTSRPTLIQIRTTIGFGSPNKAGSHEAHGSPLGPDEVALTKKSLGWDAEKHFYVPDEARAHFDESKQRGAERRADWEKRLDAYRRELPELAAELERRIAGELPAGWDKDLPGFEAGTKIATRSAAGKVLNAIAKKVPEIIGGDADLAGSTKTTLAGSGSFEGAEGTGRNIHFGVREHAMGSICNGMDGHGGVRTFAATFFCFSDYMRPAVRIAALNGQPIVYVWTHDSIGLGEDGPTHQPVEHLMSLRAMPNLHVIRPGDGNESRAAWVYAMQRTDGPTALVLSRQNLAVLDRSERGSADDLSRGAYVLEGDDDPQALILATGSEVEIAVAARELLKAGGIRTRVVSMPCWEAFAAQDASYRDQVLPPSVTARVSIEAGVTFGWSRWIGDRGVAIGVDEFGASAPAERIYAEYGLTAEAVAGAVRGLIGS